ncbi:MAG: TM2 domain-containing protein [Candidatus Thermoplasmatota archaeon]|nr:TM2 domain-containing protein [Candidatus Thermoplasmatota archaeon]
MEEQVSDVDWTTLLILSVLLGGLGVDRFYSGHVGLGVLKLITAGGCGVWALIDMIMIATGKFRDGDGLLVVNQ